MTRRQHASALGVLLATFLTILSFNRSNEPIPSAAISAELGTSRNETFGTRADNALVTLQRTLYAPPGHWTACIPNRCGTIVRDWGADALTYAMFLRWEVAHDPSIPPLLAAMGASSPSYTACRFGSCTLWSDVPSWDAVAAEREYEVTGDAATLAKARAAFAVIDGSDAFARGACPTIDFQRPGGGNTALKTLETDSNYIKAALLLYRATADPAYRAKAVAKYAAVRRYYRDSRSALYSVYVFDDGRSCRQLPQRFFASVNGNMIFNGLRLAAITKTATYLDDARATARDVRRYLNDAAGIFANLQADNDVSEPLVEAMYDLAVEDNNAGARAWVLVNAAAATPALNGSYGRFFGGPPPNGPISAWSINGGLALAIAAGALDRSATVAAPVWLNARYVADSIQMAPATIAFTGRAIALIGTIGDACCESGHVRVFIDGAQTFDNTGIWQNKSPARRALPHSTLLTWRWPTSGRHTITLRPGFPNAKEGGSFIRLAGYEYVP